MSDTGLCLLYEWPDAADKLFGGNGYLILFRFCYFASRVLFFSHSEGFLHGIIVSSSIISNVRQGSALGTYDLIICP